MPPVDAIPSAAAVAAAGVPAAQILHLLQRSSREVRELDLGRSVDRVALIDLPAMRFAAEYVQRNKPVIITGAIDSWPAMQLWGERYLESRPAGKAVVTVDVTPNGRGDAITTVADPSNGRLTRWFVTPYERRMTLREFFHFMRASRAAERLGSAPGAPPREVPYMQHQNSNLSEELGLLLDDIAPGLPWAEGVFGGPPEATNIWIGDGRSATSFHKDHYENLYAVIRGTKVFSLLPPCDLYRMYLTRCPAASYMPRRDVPAGGVYGEVSQRPGGGDCSCGWARVLRRGAVAAAAAAAGADALLFPGAGAAATPAAGLAEAVAVAGPEREAAAEMEAGADDDPARLVAVLQNPGNEVLWSAVDTTMMDPVTRRSQSLFFGFIEERGCGAAGAGGSVGSCDDGVRDGGGDAADGNGGGMPPGSRDPGMVGGSRGRTVPHSDIGHGDNDDDSDAGSSSSGGGGDDDNDPWVAAGGAPLIIEVGPGEVLYLPSLWYHQVEQYTSTEAWRRGMRRRSSDSDNSNRESIGMAGVTAAAATAVYRCPGFAADVATGATATAAIVDSAGSSPRHHEHQHLPLKGEEEEKNDAEEEEEYVIAVNFWYDMKYDSRYSGFKLVEGLAMALGLADEPPAGESRDAG